MNQTSETDQVVNNSAGTLTGGIDAFDALYVRLPICDGETATVRDLIASWAREHPDGDARTLLPVDGVNLCTLFLDEQDVNRDETRANGDSLLWYIEVMDDSTHPWTQPITAVQRSPLFHTELSTLLTGDTEVYVDRMNGVQLMTNATHPDRQQWYEQHCEHSMIAPIAGDDLPIEVATVTIPLKSGGVSWLTGRLITAGNWLKQRTPLGEWLRHQTEVLAEERMYSESLLFRPADSRLILLYYMETEDMNQLYDAYEDSDTWIVRFSDWAMHRIFEDSGIPTILERPLTSDAEVLIHAVDPERG